jgi:hypothetical protein
LHLPWDKCLEHDLPTHRHHMLTHHTTVLAAQHTVTHEMDTQWTKVTETPWTRKGQLCGGYGRRINVSRPVIYKSSRVTALNNIKLQTSTISNDAPLFFQNPDRMAKPENALPPRDASIIGNRVPRKQTPDAALYLLPGGQGILDARQTRKTFDSFRTLSHGKQVRLLANSQYLVSTFVEIFRK